MKTRTRKSLLLAMLATSFALAACGGADGGGGGADGGEDLPDSARATSEDAEGTTFPLREGRYRLSYRAPGCDDVTIQIASVDGEVVYDQHPRAYTSFVNDVPAGEYTITVTSDCDEWSINLDEF